MITLSKLAAMAHVSVSTASKAFSMSPEVPIVTIYSDGHYGIANITCAYREAMDQAIDHFLGNGIRNIGFIGDMHTKLKLGWFRDMTAGLGLTGEEVAIQVSPQRFEAGGYNAMEAFFASGKVLQGILCAYDYMAIGAIRCIRDHGLSVPEDVSVIGMDDITQAAFLNPSLSSIRFPTQACCEAAPKPSWLT